MKKHLHHIVPRSRGGSDDPSNLVEIDFIEHAIHHAQDFLNGGPYFDFRHPGWPYLSVELAEAVKKKASCVSAERQRGKPRPQAVKDAVRRRGLEDVIKKRSLFSPEFVERRKHDRDLIDRITEKVHGAKDEFGRSLTAMKTNSQKWQCTVTGKILPPGPLTGYQKTRGIDPSNRIKLQD